MNSISDKASVDYWRKLMLHYINRREKYSDKYKESLKKYQQSNNQLVDAKRQLAIAKNKLKLINNRIKEVIAGAKSNGISRAKLGYTKSDKLERPTLRKDNQYESLNRAKKKYNDEDGKVGKIYSGFHIKPKINKKQQEIYKYVGAMYN